MSDESAHHPWEIFGKRVKEARDGRGWTQQQLADRLTEQGYPIDRTMVLRIEKGRKHASLQEVFAFAAALDVEPIHLIVPLEDNAPLAVTERITLRARLARKWIRGELYVPLIVGGDVTQIPRSELRALVREHLTRDWSPLALQLAQEELEKEVDRIVNEIRERKPKEKS